MQRRRRNAITTNPVCFGVHWGSVTLDELARVDINARTQDGATPLHWAVLNNANPVIIATLLDGGADINARDTDGETPLHWAAVFNESPAIITALLDGGGRYQCTRHKRMDAAALGQLQGM